MYDFIIVIEIIIIIARDSLYITAVHVHIYNVVLYWQIKKKSRDTNEM